MRSPENPRSLGGGRKLDEPTATNPLANLAGLGELVRSHAFSGFSKEILQKWFNQGRDDLDDQRRVLFAVKAWIDEAPTKKEKLTVYKEANYPKILERIAKASSLIGIKKAVEGETITKEEQEARIRAKWIESGMNLGMTQERAARAIDNSIRFTKRVQAHVAASESPLKGGLRAVYKKEELCKKSQTEVE